MTINLSMPTTHQLKPRITVVGVGGAGGNAVNNMITSHLEGVDFVVANTDAQALAQSLSERRIQMGANITRGLGAGSQPEVGRVAAEEAIDDIFEHLEGSNMLFITAGMGGGTGTGGAPVVARAAREQGILTVGVVTKPFQFEGAHRMRLAEEGLDKLQEYVDTLIIIPNQNLFRVANEKTPFSDAFKMADDVLYSGVRGVTDLMVMPGLINLDFADVRSVMAEMGKAMMGTGEAEGEGRALIAAEAAISNPLLDDISMVGARGVLINITGSHDMTLFEADEAANRIRDEVDPEANIIFGSIFDEELAGRMRVSVVATGIGLHGDAQPRPALTVALRPSPAAIGDDSGDGFFEATTVAAQTMGQASQQEVVSEFMEAEDLAEENPVAGTIDDVAREPAEMEPVIASAPEALPETVGETAASAGGFIPPPPVSPGPKPALSATADPFAAASMSNGAQPPRGLSLFERITGGGKVGRESVRAMTEPLLKTLEPAHEEAAKPMGSRGYTVDEDELDIPAFLRR